MSFNKERFKQYSKDDEFEAGHNGKGKTHLKEPVPRYLERKGDLTITGTTDNNAMIILGRDRYPFGPPRSKVSYGSDEDPANPKSAASEVSGFSDHQGAGAIDIVVGRGAPYPIEISGLEGPQGLLPHYTTRNPKELANERLLPGAHPGYVMDAARIYISQMCHIDKYFKINKAKTSSMTIKEDSNPCSAIMLKADKLRLHSRRDIYIVAGGDPDPAGNYNDSNGYRINESGKIHLVTKNQKDPSVRPTSPAVRFNELSQCLRDMCLVMQDILELVNNFAKSQKEVNNYFANSIYGTGVGMTTCDPLAQAMNKVKQISDMKDLLQIHAVKTYSIPKIEINYLAPMASRSIASRHVTMN